MKNLVELTAASFILIFLFTFTNCNPTESEDLNLIPFEEVQMEYLDKVSIGGNLEVVINSQEEYDELIYQKFQKPLDEYWDNNYESILQSVMLENLGLTDEEYEILVRERFYLFAPFSGTENSTHLQIDFSKYTLIGQAVHSWGCELPEYIIEVGQYNNKREYVYRVKIKRKGNCEMGFNKNKWVLIQKIPKDISVKFKMIHLTK
jgi:hypothetical protein